MSIPFLNASNGQHYVFTPENNFIAIKGDGSFYTTVVEDCPKFSKNGEVCLLLPNTFLNLPTCQQHTSSVIYGRFKRDLG